MRTDWHRYNLKRRVAQLPNISSEAFAEKVLELQRQQDLAEAEEDEFGFHVNRRKSSKNERQVTKKELKIMARQAVAREGRPIDVDGVRHAHIARSASPASIVSELSEFSLGDSGISDVDLESGSEVYLSEEASELESWIESDDEAPSGLDDLDDEHFEEIIPNYYCFYCGKNNGELEQNVRHMAQKHGLYIPERSYLVHLDDLLTFLNEVITLDHECLVCGYQGKSLESIRQHMTSKGHCRLPYESPDEKRVVSEFYDFAVFDEVKRKASKKVAFQDASASDDEVAVHAPEYKPDPSAIGETLGSGILPNGGKVTHRALVKTERKHVVLRDLPELTKTVALVDRRFGPGVIPRDIVRQEKEVKRLENKAKSIAVRKLKLRKANFQPHFRDELLG